MFIPLFGILKFIFYFGWLNVAETLINPFGEDDEDFDVNYLINRNLELAPQSSLFLWTTLKDNSYHAIYKVNFSPLVIIIIIRIILNIIERNISPQIIRNCECSSTCSVQPLNQHHITHHVLHQEPSDRLLDGGRSLGGRRPWRPLPRRPPHLPSPHPWVLQGRQQTVPGIPEKRGCSTFFMILYWVLNRA